MLGGNCLRDIKKGEVESGKGTVRRDDVGFDRGIRKVLERMRE